MFVEIRFRLGSDQVDLIVPAEELAFVDLELRHEAAARRLPRRRCMRRIEIAAGVTPGIRLACPSDTGLTKLSFSVISRDKPGRANDISSGIRSSSSSIIRCASRSCRAM